MRLDEIEIAGEPADEEDAEECQLHTDEDFLEAIELLEDCHNKLKMLLKYYGKVIDTSLEIQLIRTVDDVLEFVEHFVIPNVVED